MEYVRSLIQHGLASSAKPAQFTQLPEDRKHRPCSLFRQTPVKVIAASIGLPANLNGDRRTRSIAVAMFVMPGPVMMKQTPTAPVARAYPSAMNPAPYSWCGVMSRILEHFRPRCLRSSDDIQEPGPAEAENFRSPLIGDRAL